MAAGQFTLGARLGAKIQDCRVRGCTRTFMDFSSASVQAGVTRSNDAETQGMCEPCAEQWPKLQDAQRPCAKTDCAETVVWGRKKQLEGFATGKTAPNALCGPCIEELKTLEPKEVPCSISSCETPATLSPKQQLLGDNALIETPENGVTVSGPLCKRCADKAPKFTDRQVGCGINKCKRAWTWTADEQMAAFVEGRSHLPPRRMCTQCREAFGGLVDRELRCRASSCKKTWTWSRGDQLDACTANKPVPKPPARLCESCFQIWSGLQDEERPCRDPGCKKTWVEKRGAQLARILRGRKKEPYPQYCADCAGLVEQLADRQIPCKTEGCAESWTWTREQQLAAGVRPPEKVAEAPSDQETLQNTSQAAVAVKQSTDTSLSSTKGTDKALTPEPKASPEPAPKEERAAPQNGTEANAAAVEALPAPASPSREPGPLESPQIESQTASEVPVVNRGLTPQSGDLPAVGRSRRKRRRRKGRRDPAPPARNCKRCHEFLAKSKTVELPCSTCTTPIFWPPESQLQTELGNWAVPTLCGACKRDATEAQRQADKQTLRERAGRATKPSDATTSAQSAEPPEQDAAAAQSTGEVPEPAVSVTSGGAVAGGANTERSVPGSDREHADNPQEDSRQEPIDPAIRKAGAQKGSTEDGSQEKQEAFKPTAPDATSYPDET